MKKHKMLTEFVKQEETENGAIGITENIVMISDIGKVARKHGYDCYMKGYPKEKIDYEPTNKTYQIKTIEDITKLDEKQFEFFIDDLRQYCNLMREVNVINEVLPGSVETTEGMTWLDTGLHEAKINITTSNKL